MESLGRADLYLISAQEENVTKSPLVSLGSSTTGAFSGLSNAFPINMCYSGSRKKSWNEKNPMTHLPDFPYLYNYAVTRGCWQCVCVCVDMQVCSRAYICLSESGPH